MRAGRINPRKNALSCFCKSKNWGISGTWDPTMDSSQYEIHNSQGPVQDKKESPLVQTLRISGKQYQNVKPNVGSFTVGTLCDHTGHMPIKPALISSKKMLNMSQFSSYNYKKIHNHSTRIKIVLTTIPVSETIVEINKLYNAFIPCMFHNFINIILH